MSTEYIERGALMEEIQKHTETIGVNAERLVARFPAADVKLVEHAHWKEVERTEIISDEFHRVTKKKQECTNCHIVSDEKTSFCPHCGAHMDEGSEGK